VLRRAWLVVGGLGIALLAVVGVLWLTSSSDYLISPDRARPLAGLVQVQNERAGADRGGIYYVDVLVRRASVLERLLPFVRPEGSSLLPAAALLSPGSNDRDRERQAQEQMDRSEQVAAAVAERALGYEVKARPNGALVEAVASSVPAAGVLQPEDVIVAVDGKPVRTVADLRRLVGSHRPGQRVRITFKRGKSERTATLRTVADPRNRKRPVIGIQVTPSASVKLPLKVKINLGDVGGPSAGLAFALDVMKEAGRNIANGYKVAATGELGLDGSVSPIGGAGQKAIGARHAGVDVLLVPAGENASEARRQADGLRIIPVENFQQALRALATLPRKG